MRILLSRKEPFQSGEFMKPAIVKKDIKKEFFIEEQCFIIDSSDPSDKVMSIAIARVEPGVTTVFHYLDGIDERYLMISGKGLMEVGDLPPQKIKSGDVVYIPAGTRQRITNADRDDLLFYCICTPPFEEKRYHNWEDKENLHFGGYYLYLISFFTKELIITLLKYRRFSHRVN
jgi:mannose-6-phosphate isomerase-like protein (cupin superfamily)